MLLQSATDSGTTFTDSTHATSTPKVLAVNKRRTASMYSYIHVHINVIYANTSEPTKEVQLLLVPYVPNQQNKADGNYTAQYERVSTFPHVNSDYQWIYHRKPICCARWCKKYNKNSIFTLKLHVRMLSSVDSWSCQTQLQTNVVNILSQYRMPIRSASYSVPGTPQAQLSMNNAHGDLIRCHIKSHCYFTNRRLK